MLKKDLLTMNDLSSDEILDILNSADQLKYELKHGISHKILEGKTLGMIFQKSSTRTRVSFETGMFQLGGHALFLSSRDLQIGRGEPVEDTARVLSRYLDGIMIRTYEQSEVDTLAKYASIPVINGLTDDSHPCQVLADLMTIREYKSTFSGLKVCFIGDGNNMANSIMAGCSKLGINVYIAGPKDYWPKKEFTDAAKENASKTGSEVVVTDDMELAAKDADVFMTDVWASMGMEGEAEKRKKAFEGYQVNSHIMSLGKKDAIVQHCLPAHRGEEITNEVFEKHQKEIFDEAENRLHAQKAVMVKLMSKN